jgi:YVTN family beta-propeller protein
VYLAAGSQVEVFSLASNQFVTPLVPASIGSQIQFTGLALTPDGSQLLVTNVLDNSLGVINPDTPTSTFAIPIPAQTPVNNCPVGPVYVAATSAGTAYVATGSVPAVSCPSSGAVYIANLSTRTAVAPAAKCGTSTLTVDASSDGNYVGFANPDCIYSVQNATYTQGAGYYGNPGLYGIALSGDANVFIGNNIFGDTSLTILGAVAYPVPYYANTASVAPGAVPEMLRPRLNASGSLLYVPYQNFFDIIDVQHGLLRIRFSLTETLADVLSPISIDSGGRYIFLVTNAGLTVVDLGEAPLSIGHLSLTTAAPGAQITVRGSGFDSGTTATVGGVTATVTYTDQNTLTLTVPSASTGPQDIVLTRSDGESYTLQNGIVVQ